MYENETCCLLTLASLCFPFVLTISMSSKLIRHDCTSRPFSNWLRLHTQRKLLSGLCTTQCEFSRIHSATQRSAAQNNATTNVNVCHNIWIARKWHSAKNIYLYNRTGIFSLLIRKKMSDETTQCESISAGALHIVCYIIGNKAVCGPAAVGLYIAAWIGEC